jgi:hypothetical protein
VSVILPIFGALAWLLSKVLRAYCCILAFLSVPDFILTFFFFISRQAMIDEFDLDQDGEINEQEFFSIMTDVS